MTTAVTFRLQETLVAQMELRAKELQIDLQSLVEKAIEDFLFAQRLDALRDRLGSHVKSLGFEREEDIFEEIS